MHKPDVFDYTDYRRYLGDWFTWRKSVHRRYSHRAFAREVGSTDPSVLHNVLRGRRNLGENLLDDFAVVLDLGEDGDAYFRALVRYSQAADDVTRQRAWGEVANLRAMLRKPEIDRDRLRYFSDPLYPAVRDLLLCDGVQHDPEWIGAHLEPPVSPERVLEALDLLDELGLIVRDEDGGVRVLEEMVRTGAEVERVGTMDYHARNLDRARKLVDVVRVDREANERTALIGFTARVPSDRMVELRALIFEHLHTIMATVDSWPKPDRVVQVSLQAFPLTKSTKE